MSFIKIEQGDIVESEGQKQEAVSDPTTHQLLVTLILQVMQLNKNLSGSPLVEDETKACLNID